MSVKSISIAYEQQKCKAWLKREMIVSTIIVHKKDIYMYSLYFVPDVAGCMWVNLKALVHIGSKYG